MSSTIQLLLIEDDPDHAALIRSHLGRRHAGLVQISWAQRLAAGLEILASRPIDVILLDLGLPDSSLDTTLESVLPAAKSIPVVVLSSLEDEDFALAAVHRGAQDYLCKNQLTGELLFRALRYSIERKSVEESLREALRAKDEFLTVLSHELRTPIGIIHGFAELLFHGDLAAPECKEIAEKILRTSKLQVSLIDDLLDMSRIITGNLVLRCSSVDLVPLVKAATDSVHVAAESKKITLSTVCESPIGLIQADPLRIQQIMWNLLSNALKFTPANGHIEVRLRPAESQIQIDVQDDGEGIEPGFLPYVFDRFTQQDRARTRHVGGLGIGLALVKYLVELHGGHVEVVSDGPGKGATFSIFLPALPTKSGVSPPRQEWTSPNGDERRGDAMAESSGARLP
jgi:signal transduction histidine kinase